MLVVMTTAERAVVEKIALALLDALSWPHPIGCACPRCKAQAESWTKAADEQSLADYLGGRVRANGFREPPNGGAR